MHVQVVLAAGDTFRAAAAEQLEEWARRSGADLVRADSDKARPGTVLYNVSVCASALAAWEGHGEGQPPRLQGACICQGYPPGG